VIDTLLVQVSTKALKLRRQQQGVRLIDLLHGGAVTGTCAADGGVGLLELIQRSGTDLQPAAVGL
jgi:hypothetical protein